MPVKKLLLPTQKNEVFSVVQRIGLNPAEFEWCEHKQRGYGGIDFELVSRLLHIPTDYYFTFGEFRLEWSPDNC